MGVAYLKTDVVAMLLAGGQGTRLGLLTDDIAKPAVLFGAKYRIIDFTLSNCANSGINTVGVLIQYRPLILNTYVGIGSAWDFDNKIFESGDGLTILPPYKDKDKDGGSWYTGTANAIYQNIEYIDRFSPSKVLILSGDHIYKMDYNEIIKYHDEKKADVTISVIEVPWNEASRFGIMNTNKDGKIIEFEEKPENPKSNKASMGIYVFTWKKLKEYLIMDNEDKASSHDFGKNIIPKMLANKESLVAYKFEGYWKDVGTVISYWEANMDLIQEENVINLFDRKWIFRSQNYRVPPQYIGEDSIIENSLISDGCQIEGVVKNSVIFPSVKIEKGAIIVDSVVMPGVIIERGAKVTRAIVGERAEIGEGAIIEKDGDCSDGIIIIAKREKIHKETLVSCG